ncbi:MAG: YlzJ-like family protein [Eubacteriales bacterium]|nr:YlzJ-like family protein [Bacillota bacterium]MBV1726728.1 YlzJ-like family protein [Desulforudis sp.]MDP3051625.1 YlzJ-like family protein [Eubacteriales bacterium]MDQ7788960.1 YlzJ-like family protein [Clostridia bacterium]MBV1734677.1 YlzJ-like family protein [Desulforudis sp.]
MILYTPVQPALIFENYQEHPEPPDTMECAIGGVQVLVARTGVTQGCIQRVLSTDPMDFINPALYPGTMVSFEGVQVERLGL